MALFLKLGMATFNLHESNHYECLFFFFYSLKRITRAHQTYFFPIHLCEEPRLIPSVYATVTPFIVWFAVKKLIVDPFVREQKEKHIERQREINKNK